MTRRRWIALGAVVVVLGVVGAGGWWWLSRDRAREVTIEEAQKRLGSTTTAAAGGLEGRPAQGVYEYRGDGKDSLSLPPLSQSQGPGLPGTVELLDDGCWTFRIDYSSNHWQDWKYCRRSTGLMEITSHTWQRWLIGPTALTALATFECEDTPALPEPRRPGQVWRARCSGTNDRVSGTVGNSGPYRFVGMEVMRIGGEAVDAAHFRRERTLTGAQKGTEKGDVWFAASNGLPLRNERRIELRTDTPVGASVYKESGHFELVSLRPTR
ncbi:MAG: hypothetical protein IT197_07760 [Acidimicrobiia bacterium]|nr:hypothetical protein [Acidimicrobiia bacterium]